MLEYRSYFRDSDGKIKGTQILDCEDDTAAAVKAEILLAERQNCTTAPGRRLVHRGPRGRAGDECTSPPFSLAASDESLAPNRRPP